MHQTLNIDVNFIRVLLNSHIKLENIRYFDSNSKFLNSISSISNINSIEFINIMNPSNLLEIYENYDSLIMNVVSHGTQVRGNNLILITESQIESLSHINIENSENITISIKNSQISLMNNVTIKN